MAVAETAELIARLQLQDNMSAGLRSATGGLSAAAGQIMKEFGFNILDVNGKVKDAQSLLSDYADYWNSGASAEAKTALGAQLFGRQWQVLLPILQQGSGAIRDAADEAKALGLTQD